MSASGAGEGVTGVVCPTAGCAGANAGSMAVSIKLWPAPAGLPDVSRNPLNSLANCAPFCMPASSNGRMGAARGKEGAAA